jgi:hypothetical protein
MSLPERLRDGGVVTLAQLLHANAGLTAMSLTNLGTRRHKYEGEP